MAGRGGLALRVADELDDGTPRRVAATSTSSPAPSCRVREFVVFSARNPQLHRIITQESKADSARMEYLVEHHVRPLYEATVALFEHLVRDGVVPAIAPAHLYYLLIGAGPTMFVLAPECRRLTGLDPGSDEVIEAHADAVCTLLFGQP